MPGRHRRDSSGVSIRASAREATPAQRDGHAHPAVSIRTSAREATVGLASPVDGRRGFNPRLRAGGDALGTGTCASLELVSIRASAREATAHEGVVLDGGGFQSAPPRGRRHVMTMFWRTAFVFQSAPPRGRRH